MKVSVKKVTTVIMQALSPNILSIKLAAVVLCNVHQKGGLLLDMRIY